MIPSNQLEERTEMNQKTSQTTTTSLSQLWSREDQLMFLQFQRETHTPQMDQLPSHQPSTKVSHTMTEIKRMMIEKHIKVNNKKVGALRNEKRRYCYNNKIALG